MCACVGISVCAPAQEHRPHVPQVSSSTSINTGLPMGYRVAIRVIWVVRIIRVSKEFSRLTMIIRVIWVIRGREFTRLQSRSMRVIRFIRVVSLLDLLECF